MCVSIILIRYLKSKNLIALFKWALLKLISTNIGENIVIDLAYDVTLGLGYYVILAVR